MPEDPTHIRQNQTSGEAMMNVALALMRDVKEEVVRMSDKLDKIAEKREEDAREHGGLEVRISNLEASHSRHIKVVYSLFVALATAYLLLKLQLR